MSTAGCCSQELLLGVHEGFDFTSEGGDKSTTRGLYAYYHYGCDGFDDRGWGCGYRTLQTLASWIRHELQQAQGNDSLTSVPSILEIQKLLTDMQDKPPRFVRSRDWIGSFEIALVLEQLYDIPSKIIHVNSGAELPKIFPQLQAHFGQFGSPGMMGGDSDASSKGIFGTLQTADEEFLLIVDPHFWGKPHSKEELWDKGWVKWQPLSDFSTHSFYNICLPQIKSSVKS